VLSRRTLTRWVLAVVAALALGPIAAALASGGPSAGNNQYSDPLANTTPTTHQAAPPPATTTPTPTSTPAPVTSAPPVTSTADPTTTADPATTTTTGKTLPMTGYDAWLGGAFGVFLVAGGIAVRRRYAIR
jgi:cytoskeletal protein RodZ